MAAHFLTATVGRSLLCTWCSACAAAFSQVYADVSYTGQLHSNDHAGTSGAIDYGQCNVPATHARVTCSQVYTYIFHAVPLHSDSRAGACGAMITVI
jgi:hypothetical protein